MLKRIVSTALFISVFISFISQTVSEPPIEWQSINWSRRDMSGNFVTSGEGTGEDWWYKHINVYENGVHTGYLAVGYSTWALTPDNLTIHNSFHSLGCVVADGNAIILSPLHPKEDQLENQGYFKGSFKGMASLYNLKGEMIWCRTYNIGDLQEVVQSGNDFIMIGSHSSNLSERTGLEIPYNRTSTNPNNTFNTCVDLNNDGIDDPPGSKIHAVKINMQGQVIWEGLYGDEDYINYNQAYKQNYIGYGITKIASGYIVVGKTNKIVNSLNPNTNVDVAYTIVIDENGNKISERIIPSTYVNFPSHINNSSTHQVNSQAFGVKSDNNGNNLIFGLISDNPSTELTNFHRGWVLNVDDNLNDKLSWTINPFVFESAHSVKKNSKVWDGGYHQVNNEFLVPVIQDCQECLFAGQNEGDFYLYRFNVADGTLNGGHFLGIATAYDLRAQAIETKDGGIAVISSQKDVSYQNVDDGNNGLNANLIYSTPSEQVIIPPYFHPAPFFHKTWDTDAFVTKLDGNGNIIWQKTFDSEPTPRARQPFPGDLKRQECLYAITESEDGGLVISGNTSHNFDDMYLAKIASDCQYRAYLNAQPEDISQGVEYLQTGGTITWNSDKKVFQKIVIDASTTLIIDGATIEFADYVALNERNKLAQNDINLLIPSIEIYPGSKLIIKNGAVLKGMFTCNKEGNWLGIQVIGTPNALQDPTSQGVIEIENSTIENAYIGILANGTNFNQNGVHTSDVLQYGGGIVKATNTNFINCRRGIHFTSYPWSEGKTSSLSLIHNCNFINDDLISNAQGEDPLATNSFVSIWNYHGITIQGNRFEFDDTNPNLNFVWNKRPKGIIVWDATLNVSNFCNSGVIGSNNTCVGGTFISNEFTNLNKGIELNGIVGAPVIKIDGCVFYDNQFGVTLEGIPYAKITNCNFSVSERQITVGNATTIGKHYGIYTTSAVAYGIENNVFNNISAYNSNSPFNRSIGVYAENTNFIGNSGSVRLNDFNNVSVGVQYAKNNATVISDCNDYTAAQTNADFDWAISSGKLAPQGNDAVPAANTFRDNCSGVQQIFHYNSGLVNDLIYNTSSDDAPLCFSTPFVNVDASSSGNNNCEPQISGGGLPVSFWVNNWTTQKGIKNTLSGLITAGDAPNIYASIVGDPHYLVRTKLLAASPYLSDAVLITLVESNVADWVISEVLQANTPLSADVLTSLITTNLPAWILDAAFNSSKPINKEVLTLLVNSNKEAWLVNTILKANSPLFDETLLALAQNTHYPAYVIREVMLLNTPLSANVMDALYSRNPSLPNWVINEINNSNYIAPDPNSIPLVLSSTQALQSNIAVTEARRANALDNIVSIYVAQEKIDSARYYLTLDSSLAAKSALVMLAINTDLQSASDYITAIRSEIILLQNPEQKQELTAFCDFYTHIIAIRSQNGSLSNLTTQQKQFIIRLSNENTATAILASNILKLIDNWESDLKGEPIDEEAPKSSIQTNYVADPIRVKLTDELNIKVYPNPAEDYINFDVSHTTESDNRYVLTIYDLQGRIIKEQPFNVHQYTLDTKELINGIYIYKLSSSLGTGINGRFIISK